MNELAEPWYSDQILPFDVTLAGANEYGAMAAAKILGIETRSLHPAATQTPRARGRRPPLRSFASAGDARHDQRWAGSTAIFGCITACTECRRPYSLFGMDVLQSQGYLPGRGWPVVRFPALFLFGDGTHPGGCGLLASNVFGLTPNRGQIPVSRQGECRSPSRALGLIDQKPP